MIKAKGSTQAKDFETSIVAERGAISDEDAAALEAAAVDQLELVDGVERVYSSTVDAPD